MNDEEEEQEFWQAGGLVLKTRWCFWAIFLCLFPVNSLAMIWNDCISASSGSYGWLTFTNTCTQTVKVYWWINGGTVGGGDIGSQRSWPTGEDYTINYITKTCPAPYIPSDATGYPLSRPITPYYCCNGRNNCIDITEKRNVTVAVSPAGYGSATQNGSISTTVAYSIGTTVTLAATPVSTCFRFARWIVNGSDAGTNSSIGIKVTQDMQVTAQFVMPDADGDGVPDCLDSCKDTPPGAQVDSAGCLQKYAVTVRSDPGDGGSVQLGAPGPYPWGSTAVLTAVPARWHELVGWTGTEAWAGNTNPLQITITKPTDITAIFRLKDSDLDGVADKFDGCPRTPGASDVDTHGCPPGLLGRLAAVLSLLTAEPPPSAGTIVGKVTDAATQAGLSGVTVSTSNGSYVAATDASGNYTIANVTPGTYTVTASKAGYVSGTGSVALTDGATETFNLGLTAQPPPPKYHSADYNPRDYRISLSELLRVIQLKNSMSYHVDAAGEDGYAPGAGSQDGTPHSSDHRPQDWTISLSELLRLIQFYNSGGYHVDPAGEDEFAPGP